MTKKEYTETKGESLILSAKMMFKRPATTPIIAGKTSHFWRKSKNL